MFNDFFLLWIETKQPSLDTLFLHAPTCAQFCECYWEAIKTVIIYIYTHIYIYINEEESRETTRKMEVYGDYSETSERRQLVRLKGIGIYN